MSTLNHFGRSIFAGMKKLGDFLLWFYRSPLRLFLLLMVIECVRIAIKAPGTPGAAGVDNANPNITTFITFTTTGAYIKHVCLVNGGLALLWHYIFKVVDATCNFFSKSEVKEETKEGRTIFHLRFESKKPEDKE